LGVVTALVQESKVMYQVVADGKKDGKLIIEATRELLR